MITYSNISCHNNTFINYASITYSNCIIGAGGIGREVTFIIEEINKQTPTLNILGFIDDNKEIHGKVINGYSVLGDLSYLDNYHEKEEKPEVVISIANYNVKKNIVLKLNNRFNFATIIHPEVSIHNTVTIGNGSIIYKGVIMTTNITIGNHVIVAKLNLLLSLSTIFFLTL